MRSHNPLSLKGSLSRSSISHSLMSFSFAGGFQAHSSSSTTSSYLCSCCSIQKFSHKSLCHLLEALVHKQVFSGAFCRYFLSFWFGGGGEVVVVVFWGLLACLLIYHRMVSVGRATKIIHFQPCAMDGNSFH